MKTNWILAAGLLSGGSISAATVFVEDWLVLGSGGSAGNFTLLNNSNAVAASGSLTLTQGVTFPGLPSERLLNDEFWTEPVPVDSLLGSQSISAFEMRVVPQNGAADYQVELVLNSSAPFVLMIAELYGDSLSQTASVRLDAAGGTISYLGSAGWDNGLRSYNGELTWDSGGSLLSRGLASAEGDSKAAFFLIEPRVGGPASVVLNVPNGYGSGAGDSLTFALGTTSSIPEPSSLVLALIGAGGVLHIRRRRASF